MTNKKIIIRALIKNSDTVRRLWVNHTKCLSDTSPQNQKEITFRIKILFMPIFFIVTIFCVSNVLYYLMHVHCFAIQNNLHYAYKGLFLELGFFNSEIIFFLQCN